MANYVSKKIEDDVVASLKRIGSFVTAKLRAAAPVDTGRLKKSITYSITKTTGGYRLYFGYIYYGMFVDLGVNGTVKKYGSPFSYKKRKLGLKPTHWADTTAYEDEIAAMVEDAFDKTLDEVISDLVTRSQKNIKK